MDDDTGRHLLDELAAEFMARRRRGETPTMAEYTDRHPDLAEEIRDLFPAISALENLKDRAVPTPGAGIRTAGGRLTRLDEFEVAGEIGRGGMGVVYDAVQKGLDRPAALKVLLAPLMSGPDTLNRFRREAQIAARLQHPNIVPIYRFGAAAGHQYIAMQRINGVGWDRLVDRLAAANQGDPAPVPESAVDDGWVLTALAQALHGNGPGRRRDASGATPWTLPLAGKAYRFGAGYDREVAVMGQRAAAALAYAHGQGVWHRDIKPSNLILDVDGQVWVTDFGLAKLQGADSLTATGKLMGTLRFMAPENFDGRHDARSDVYSLGLTLYELATLRPAFQGKNQSELIHRILHEPPQHPREINPFIPEALEAVILCAAAKSPSARYHSADAMARDLQRFIDGRPVLAAVAGPAVVPPPTRRRRFIIPLALIAAALIVYGAAALFLLTADQPEPLPEPAVKMVAPKPATPVVKHPAPPPVEIQPTRTAAPPLPSVGTATPPRLSPAQPSAGPASETAAETVGQRPFVPPHLLPPEERRRMGLPPMRHHPPPPRLEGTHPELRTSE